MTETTQENQTEASTSSKEDIKHQETVRVNVSLLEKLMSLTGELVLIRNQLLVYADKSKDDIDFQNMSQQLNLVTSELQNEVMKTRMQPIGNVITKFHRVVRDLAKQLGKNIELKITGAETELDKTLLEAVKDPLTHIIRNAADHGIEVPDVRKRSGKSEKGRINIRAYHEGGQVVVEISDDGKGLDKNKLLEKAIEKNVVSKSDAAKLNDSGIYNLIFAPGFSTAQKVSNISGRGVGMDVVRTNVEKIGGSIDLTSELGKGTSIRLKVPLTLAIIPALIVKSQGNRFAIPQVKLIELVRAQAQSDNNHAIEWLQGSPVYRLRGDILPLVSLNSLLFGTAIREDIEELETINIAVLSSEEDQFGLIIDEIHDSTDIVVKPMSKFLSYLNAFAGSTVMGDGQVCLVLDINGIAKTGITNQPNKQNTMENIEEEGLKKNQEQDLLMVDIGYPGHYALPLNLVNRLEEFPKNKVECSGEINVVQYRGAILPLIEVGDLLFHGQAQSNSDDSTLDSIYVVVFEYHNQLIGLKVNRILDVVCVSGDVQTNISGKEGLLGQMIHQNSVVDIIDPMTIATKSGLNLKYDENSNAMDITKQRANFNILLAEDGKFFRKQMVSYLSDAGYQVNAFEDGQLAWNEFENQSEKYDLLLSDIEMPKLTGLELAKRIRNSERNQIPMIAITTRFTSSDIKEGMESGFNKYIEKFDPKELIETVDSLLINNVAEKSKNAA